MSVVELAIAAGGAAVAVAGWVAAFVVGLRNGGLREERADLAGKLAAEQGRRARVEADLADAVGAAEDERWRHETLVASLNEAIEELRQRALACAADDQIRDGLAALAERARDA